MSRADLNEGGSITRRSRQGRSPAESQFGLSLRHALALVCRKRMDSWSGVPGASARHNVGQREDNGVEIDS
jgi:hypothetical protein